MSVQKAAEAYCTENGVYPTTPSNFNDGSARLPLDIKILITDYVSDAIVDASNGEEHIAYIFITEGN